MRGAFIIVILITMLIAAFLVTQNLRTGPVEGSGKVESIQKAKDTVEVVDAAVKKRTTTMDQ
jgi:hypothetical protein